MAFCQMYFGPPGSGKTTLAVQKAKYYQKQGYKVFTNFPVLGCFKMDSSQLGNFEFRNAVCIVDEAGIDFNNRNWKNFSQKTTQYVKLHRHYETNFLFFSQGWDDCDKKIRTICTEYFYLKKLGPWTLYRQIKKDVGIEEISKQIIDEYFKLGVLRGGLHGILRKKYYKYFDSWEAPPLPPAPEVLWDSLHSKEPVPAQM